MLYNKYMGGVDKGLIRWKKTARKTIDSRVEGQGLETPCSHLINTSHPG